MWPLSSVHSLFLCIGAVRAQADTSWPVAQLPDTSALYPGEKMLSTDGIESLTYFKRGEADKPLIVFVPGGFHLARVAYGYPGGKESDFLSHWVGELGYSFLGVSYPTGNKVYSKVYPAFSIRDWGKQVAAVARHYIEEEGLSKDMIVLGWSAGGQIAQSVYEAARAEALNMELFVSLASTPPMPLLRVAPGAISKAPNGLSAAPRLYELFRKYVVQQNELNGHTIIPWPTFEAEILGDIPVALNAIMMASRYENGEFVEDLEWSIQDTGALKFTDFPLVVTISGNKVLDGTHALTDRGNWGIYQIQHLYRNVVLPALQESENIEPREWQELMDQMTNATSGILSSRVIGNHFFWYGEAGARETAYQVAVLHDRATTLRLRLEAVVETIQRN